MNMNLKLSSLMAQNLIGKAATEAAEKTSFPIETCHLMALCHASWAVGMHYKIAYYDGESIPVNLFYMAEARSGEGKNRTMKLLSKGLVSALENERASRAKRRNDLLNAFADNNEGKPEKASRIERELHEQDLAKSHDLTHAVSDLNGASFDAMLRDQHGWFMLKTTEQGLIDGLLMGSHTDGSVNIDPILNAFDGEYTETRRISRQGFSGIPHGGIGIISQSGLIEKMLEVSGNRGLTQRFFMVLEPSMMGRRVFSRKTKATKNLDTFNAICEQVAKDGFESVKVYDFKNLQTLHISDEGWDYLYEVIQDIEVLLGPGGKYEPEILSSMWSKLKNFVMKVSATLHIMNYGNEKKPIPVDVVREAVSYVVCLFTGVSDIAEKKGIVGISVEERVILDYMAEKGRIRPMDERAIKNALSRRKVFAEYADNKSRRVMEVVEQLVKSGKIMKQNIDGSDWYKFVRY